MYDGRGDLMNHARPGWERKLYGGSYWCSVQSRNRADEGKQHGFRERTSRLVSLVKRRVFQKGGPEMALLDLEVHIDRRWQQVTPKQSPKGPYSLRWLVP